MAEVDRRMEQHKPMDLSATVEEIREFVYRNVMQLRTLLRDDAARSKAALSRHVGQLVLKPKQTPSGPVYEVLGGLDMLAGRDDVMLMVARDGIGTPTAIEYT
jgi:hypothetical protein